MSNLEIVADDLLIKLLSRTNHFQADEDLSTLIWVGFPLNILYFICVDDSPLTFITFVWVNTRGVNSSCEQLAIQVARVMFLLAFLGKEFPSGYLCYTEGKYLNRGVVGVKVVSEMFLFTTDSEVVGNKGIRIFPLSTGDFQVCHG